MKKFGIFKEVKIPQETLNKNKPTFMLSEKRLFHLRTNTAALCIALFVSLFFLPILSKAEERSYAREIEQYVAEDKVYLLENIRQNITRPSEETVVEALLSESGPEAIELFRKQLRDYPDPLLNKLSTSRIAAYSMALNGTGKLPQRSQPLAPEKEMLATAQDTTGQKLALIAEKQASSAQVPPPIVPERPRLKTVAPLTFLQKKPTPKTLHLSPSLAEKSKPEPTGTTKSNFTLQFGSFTSKENAEALAQKVSLYEPAKTIQQGEFYKVFLKKNYASKEEVAALVKELPFLAIIVPVKVAQH